MYSHAYECTVMHMSARAHTCLWIWRSCMSLCGGVWVLVTKEFKVLLAAHGPDALVAVQGEIMDAGDQGPSLQTHYNRHVLTDLTLTLLQESNWCDLPNSKPCRLTQHMWCQLTVPW